VTFTDITSGYQATTIAAAHAAGLRCVLTIGGATFGSNFAASATSFMSTFVTSIVSAMTTYGYDGLDIDWEEDVTQALFTSLHQNVRAAMPASGLLTTDVDMGQHTSAVVTAVAPYVSHINCLTYYDNGASTITYYTGAGIPPGQLTLGLGINQADAPEVDTTQAAVTTKCNYAIANNLGGVSAWEMGALTSPSTDGRLIPLRAYTATYQ
jgi:hypothetical protein